MALSVTHTYVSSVADSSAASAAGKILPQAHWNAAHAVSGNLPVTQLNSGIGASAATFWRGDGLWTTSPSSGGGGTDLGIVNVKTFGAIGDGITDDTASIQAAIDYAYSQNIQTTYFPPGNYKTTAPLWLDPFTNMRGGGANPTSPAAGAPPPNFGSPPMAQFSLDLIGDPGGANGELDGTRISPTFSNDACIYVGPGQGMKVAHLNIVFPFGQTRGTHDVNGIGIGYCGNGSGSRTETLSIWVQNIYTAFKTSANGNQALGDANTWYKCQTTNTYYGTWIAGTQNFMNTFYDCLFSNQTVAIFTAVGAGAKVFGGNMSGNSGEAACFTIGTTSALTVTPFANSFTYSFTTTITAPDSFINTPIYNSYVIQTARFGLIPLTLTNWNSGTSLATFSTQTSWSEYYSFQIDLKTNADLQAEIQACNVLYAAERKVTFWGTGIECHGGTHVENGYAPTTLIISDEAIGSQPNSHLSGLVFNVDPSLSNLSGSAAFSASLAKFYNAQAWPFIWLVDAIQVTIENCILEMDGTQPVIVQHDSQFSRLVMRENSRWGPVISRVATQGGSDGTTVNAAALGGGDYDASPFLSTSPNNNGVPGDHWRSATLAGTHPVWGWRPTEWTRPAIISSSLVQLAGTLPAISVSGGLASISYPLLWGGQIYSVYDGPFVTTPTQNYEVSSNHHYYTYGQNLTTANVTGLAWSYKGKSFCIYADANTLSILFSGLGVKLYDGATENLYLVTGVFPALGYFTISGVAVGNKITIFTSTTNQIGQEPFAIAQVSGPITPVMKNVDFTVAALENNIVVNQASTTTVTLPSASTYSGRTILIRTIQAQTVVSATANVIPRAGGAASTAILAATAGNWAMLVANGTNWDITQSN